MCCSRIIEFVLIGLACGFCGYAFGGRTADVLEGGLRSVGETIGVNERTGDVVAIGSGYAETCRSDDEMFRTAEFAARTEILMTVGVVMGGRRNSDFRAGENEGTKTIRQIIDALATQKISAWSEIGHRESGKGKAREIAVALKWNRRLQDRWENAVATAIEKGSDVEKSLLQFVRRDELESWHGAKLYEDGEGRMFAVCGCVCDVTGMAGPFLSAAMNRNLLKAKGQLQRYLYGTEAVRTLAESMSREDYDARREWRTRYDLYKRFAQVEAHGDTAFFYLAVDEIVKTDSGRAKYVAIYAQYRKLASRSDDGGMPSLGLRRTGVRPSVMKIFNPVTQKYEEREVK